MVLGLIGNIAGNLDQDAFVQGAENENRLQQLQRANQNRINRDFFRNQQGGPPELPTPQSLNQGSAGLNLDNFGGQYIDVPPPLDQEGGVAQGIDEADAAESQLTIPAVPEVTTEELDQDGGVSQGQDQIDQNNTLLVPDFDPNKELGFDNIGQSGVTDITQVDPESSAFVQDIQKKS